MIQSETYNEQRALPPIFCKWINNHDDDDDDTKGNIQWATSIAANLLQINDYDEDAYLGLISLQKWGNLSANKAGVEHWKSKWG